jgi:ABC-2 type transport system permease protein
MNAIDKKPAMPVGRYLQAIAAMNLRELGACRISSLVQVLFMLLNNLVFFSFWVILYGNVEHVRGLRLEDVAFMYAVAAGAVGLAVATCGGVSRMAETIGAGKLEIYLTQPRDVQLQVLLSRADLSGWGDVLSAVVMIAFYCGASPAAWLTWLVATLIGAVVFVSTASIMHSIAFWIPRSERLAEQLFEFLLIFSLYPNSIFSGSVRALTYTLLPAAYISFFPVLVRTEGQPLYLVGSALAAVVYFLLSRWVFRAGLRRYEAGSTFVSVR